MMVPLRNPVAFASSRLGIRVTSKPFAKIYIWISYFIKRTNNATAAFYFVYFNLLEQNIEQQVDAVDQRWADSLCVSIPIKGGLFHSVYIF